MKPVIAFEGVGKKYRLGQSRRTYASLREDVSTWLSRARRRQRALDREFWALRDVSFDVPEGTALGIVGRNGAGKSTLLKVLAQITPPTVGRITVRGRIASLLEVGTGFHPELTGRENIFLNGAILGMTHREVASRLDEIVAFAEVEKFLDTPVKHYSSGMYVRLAFAVAAHIQPEVLVIDEVLAVGDVSFQKKCLGRMGDVARSGRTVLFVSHNLGMVQNLCTHSVLIKQGRLLMAGGTDEVVAEYLRDLTEDAAIALGERSDREGTGDVRVSSVVIRNEALEAVSTVQCGGTCYVDFVYESAREPRDVAIAWNVRDQLGQPIFRASSADTGDDAGTFPRHGVIRCAVPRLPLIPGRYHATIEVRVGGIVADYVQGAFSLVVEGGDFYGTGRIGTHSPVLIEHSWIQCVNG